MRIIQISPYSWDAPGGVQVHIRQLSRHLRERGHDVLVLAPGEHPGIRDGARIVGRPVAISVNGSVARLCFSRRSAHLVRKAFAVFRPDVIHVHDPLTPSTSMLGILNRNAPTVATFHSYFTREHFEGRLYSVLAPFLRPVWRRVDRRVAVSEAAKESVCSRMGAARIDIVPNGADIDVFASAEPAELPPGRRLLFVGRLEPRKGFPVAVEAFAQLASRYPDLQLVVVGDGDDRTAVNALPTSLRARVLMQGRVSDEMLPRFHRAADVFISPATGQESFGIVLVEAMAAGLPLVASDIPGYREVARHDCEGVLVAPSNATALASGIARVLDDRAFASRLGKAGSERANAFTWDKIIDRLEVIYEDLSSGRRGPPLERVRALPRSVEPHGTRETERAPTPAAAATRTPNLT